MANVVDSNVWAIMDNPQEKACALACLEWGSSFSKGNGHAIIPFNLDDEADRKFVAVAMHFNPPASIVNATDTDWEKDGNKLAAAGLALQELCPDYIREKLDQ